MLCDPPCGRVPQGDYCMHEILLAKQREIGYNRNGDYFENQKGIKDKDQEVQNNGGSGVAELSIAKHRNGATGGIKLVFLKEYVLFSNYSKVEEEQ